MFIFIVVVASPFICFAQHTSYEYCGNPWECTNRACDKIRNGGGKPDCDNNWSIRREFEDRFRNCNNLNQCLWERPLNSLHCTSTLRDCPKFYMCRNSQCWPSSMKKSCYSKWDCGNGLYDCISGECKIGQQSSNSGNGWYNNEYPAVFPGGFSITIG